MSLLTTTLSIELPQKSTAARKTRKKAFRLSTMNRASLVTGVSELDVCDMGGIPPF
jgi:hypothetical protein